MTVKPAMADRADDVRALIARIEADRAEIATERELRAVVEVSLTNLRRFAENPITPRYDAPMSGDAIVVRDILAAAFGREIALTQANDAQSAEIAALKGENAQLIEVYDHAQTGLKSMRAQAAKDAAEIARLKANNGALATKDAEWSKAMGINPTVSPEEAREIVATSNREREAEIARLKAEVERPRCNDLLCRCCTGRAR